MTVLVYGRVPLGHAQAFDPAVDVLRMPDSEDAARVHVQVHDPARVFVGYVELLTPLASLTSGNIVFPNGSVLVVGDNATGVVNDSLDNLLTATGHSDQLIGLGGADTMAAGAGDDLLLGGDGDDSLAGEEGADTLDGGAGRDTLIGGAGNDWYYFDASDGIIESGDGGSDTAFALTSITFLPDNIEMLQVGDPFDPFRHDIWLADLDAAGNDQDNQIRGNEGNNHLYGLGGNDLIFGGVDQVYEHDSLYGGSGDDTLSVYSPYIIPSYDVSVLDGGDGSDVLQYFGRPLDLMVPGHVLGVEAIEPGLSLALDAESVVVTSDTDVLRVIGGHDGFVLLEDGGWESVGPVAVDGLDYIKYTKDAATLLLGDVIVAGPGLQLNLDSATPDRAVKFVGVPTSASSASSAVSAADVNHDGYTDLLIGTSAYTYQTNSGTFALYVVEGGEGGFSGLDLSQLGATLTGDVSGIGLSGSGDFNGDGAADIILGAGGHRYLLLGGAAGFDDLQLSALDGSRGFEMTTVGSAEFGGDVNGDGYDDLIIGDARENGFRGASYVIFGQGSGAPTDLSALDGSNGFRLIAHGTDDFGRSVSSAGDINGDGFDDLLIGAEEHDEYSYYYVPGRAYVLFGKASGFSSELDLATLNGDNGFIVIGGDNLGIQVRSAGDFNGDGFDDLLLGSLSTPGYHEYGRSASAYVIFGSASGFPRKLDVTPTYPDTSLDPSVGILLHEFLHQSIAISSAGDFNGDGFDDVIVAGSSSLYDHTGGGATIFFGKASASDPIQTLKLQAGIASPVGDVNGDGFDDLLVPASSDGTSYLVYGFDPVHEHVTLRQSELAPGASYPFYPGPDILEIDSGVSAARLQIGGTTGKTATIDASSLFTPFASLTPDSVRFADGSLLLIGDRTVGTVEDELTNKLLGGEHDDYLNGLGGDDSLEGGAGGDRVIGGDGDDRLLGGPGDDTLVGGSGDDLFWLDSQGDTVVERANKGDDQVRSSASIDVPIKNVEQLVLLTGENLHASGNNLDNLIKGNPGSNTLYGLAGDDSIVGGTGGDTLKGGFGNDSLAGGAGNDRLYGHDGADTLDGGAGNDRMWGNAGSDTFRFSGALAGVDGIMDFSAVDAIQLNQSVFSALSAGALATGSFVSGVAPVAADADDFILYDTATGEVYYDADGNGTAVAVKFAFIDGSPDTLAASDFIVV